MTCHSYPLGATLLLLLASSLPFAASQKTADSYGHRLHSGFLDVAARRDSDRELGFLRAGRELQTPTIDNLENATVFEQEEFNHMKYWNCYETGDMTNCLGGYVAVFFFTLGLLACLCAGFLKLCSSSERRARAEKKFQKAKSSRKGREFELGPVGGIRDSELSRGSFEGVKASNAAGRTGVNNPMSSASSKTPKKGLPPGWRRETDEEGNVYFVNESTGESQWENPNGYKGGKQLR